MSHYSAPLKRSRTLQSGHPVPSARPAFPHTNSDSTGINSNHQFVLGSDMAFPYNCSTGGPSSMPPSLAQIPLAGNPLPEGLGGVAMAQAPSNMSYLSQNSYQLSACGSPILPRQMPTPAFDYIGNATSPTMGEDVLMNPAEFLQSKNFGYSSSPLPISVPSFFGAGLDGSPVGSYSTMTDNMTLNSDSLSGVPLFPQTEDPTTEMTRVHSQQSWQDTNDYSHLASDASEDYLVECMDGLYSGPSTQWESAGMEPSTTTDTQWSLSQGASQIQMDHALSAHRMERTTSSGRNRSQRLRETAQRQLNNGKNQILPKDAPSLSRSTHPAVAGSVPSRAPAPHPSLPNTGKMVISKARRERPKNKKLFCEFCTNHSEGFRGQHELARHVKRRHAPASTRYICIDPRPQGIGLELNLRRPLEDCKNCRGKKQYGADYNAAVHLRRAHFSERPSRTKGASAPSAQEDSNSYPAMEDLKNWIQVVPVSLSHDTAADESSQSALADPVFCDDDGDNFKREHDSTDDAVLEFNFALPGNDVHDVEFFSQHDALDLGMSSMPRHLSSAECLLVGEDNDVIDFDQSQASLDFSPYDPSDCFGL